MTTKRPLGPLLLVVEGVTNTGKSTLVRGLQEWAAAACVTMLDASVAFKEDPLHKAVAEITSPSTYAAWIDPVSEIFLYGVHLVRRVVSIRQAIESNVDLVVADRLDASLIAMGAARARNSEAVAMYVARNCLEQLQDVTRINLLLTADWAAIDGRAVTSPFTRKDADLRATARAQAEGMEAFLRSRREPLLVLDTTSLTTDEVLAQVTTWLKPIIIRN